ncbi:MAG TPA: hypothetical protein VGN83_25850 [Falsiroseomonas sp.]|jgi:hypothetical protein|nr:hypothetical protein [Falsiroseomonas sp.]
MTKTTETKAIRELTAEEMTQAGGGGTVIIERSAERGIIVQRDGMQAGIIVQRGIIVQ